MATCLPPTISSSTSSAERRVFEALKRLPDDFLVFSLVRWIGLLGPEGRKAEGEADFIVAHERRGLLIIEVKGGLVSFRDGYWIVNRSEADEQISNPVQQAQKNKYALLEKLKHHSRWHNRHIIIGHCVALPDVAAMPNDPLPADLARALLFDQTDMRGLDRNVIRALDYFSRQTGVEPLGADGMSVLREVLAPNTRLRPLLKHQINEDEKELVKATEEQLHLLDQLRFNPRALITGCAGTGKTVCAIERAQRLANEGHKTLFTCFNRKLADHLAKDVPANPNLTIANFHKLCSDFARKAHLRTGCPVEEYPQLLQEAAEQLGPLFDAIVVDEGQDFNDLWWVALLSCHIDPQNGVLQIFCDPHQKIYSFTPASLPVSSPRFVLSRNCRNTQAIHSLVRRFFQSDEPYHPTGPEGLPVKWMPYNDTLDMIHVLDDEIRRLVSEGVAPNDIVVLTCKGYENTEILHPRPSMDEMLAHAKRIAAGEKFEPPSPELENIRQVATNLFLKKGWPAATINQVAIETVRRFKGLESSVVILCEIEAVEEQSPWQALFYIGGSRARAQLIILHPKTWDKVVKKSLLA